MTREVIADSVSDASLGSSRFVDLLLAQVGVAYANSSFLILPKLLTTRLGAGPEQIGQVVLISSLALVVSLLPAGSLVDRHGRRRFLTASAALMGIACAAHVFVDTVGPLLYCLRVLQALAFAYAAGAALAIDAAPPARLGQALGIGYGGAFNFHQPFALSLGITELRDFFLAHSLAAGASRIVTGPFVDRIGLRRISLASLALYAAAVLAIVWLDRIGLLVLGLGIGVSHGLFYPAYTGVVLEGCAPAERGRYVALLQARLYVGIGVGGAVLGLIAGRWGYPVIFVLGSAALVGAFALIAFERPPVGESRITATT